MAERNTERARRARDSKRLLGIVLLIVVLVTVNAGVAFRAVDSLSSRSGWVSHTWEVMGSLERVLSLLKDAETGSRGYVLTGEDQYLSRVRNAEADIPAELNRFQNLVADNPRQQARLSELRQEVNRRLDLLRENNRRKTTGRYNLQRADAEEAIGAQSMAHVRALIAQMEVEERDLLAQREEAVQSSYRNAILAVSLASALDVILSLVMLRFSMKERQMRAAAEQSNSQMRKLQLVSDTALTQLSAKDLTTELLQRLREALTADVLALYTLEEQTLNLYSVQGGESGAGAVRNDVALRAALEQKGPLLLHGADAVRLPLLGLDGQSLRSAILVRLPLGDRSLGVLVAARVQLVDFTEQQEQLLVLAADRIALGLDRALLYEGERQARQEAETNAAEVRSLNEHLEELVRQRTAELQAAIKELEAFSYSVSHDLRAPLRTVDGFSLALEEDYREQLGKEGQDFIRRVRAGVQRMGELIDALLQLSRISRAELTVEDVNLSAMASDIAFELQRQNPERDIEFRIEPEMHVDGDPRLLRVALENLIGNAVKFTGKIDHAVIEFGRGAGDEPAYFVRDNGAGFDSQYAGKLFSAFQRLHGDKDFKGSGIGLANVARVVRRHGGQVWAEGEISKGATFWFSLGRNGNHGNQS